MKCNGAGEMDGRSAPGGLLVESGATVVVPTVSSKVGAVLVVVC